MIILFKLCNIDFIVIVDLVVGLRRLELPTSRLSGVCSNQLSYKPTIKGYHGCGELAGLRTRDPLIKSQMLYRLSYELLNILYIQKLCFTLSPKKANLSTIIFIIPN